VVLRADLTMANADDAKVMADSIAEWKKMGLAGLDQLPPQLKPAPEALTALKKTLEGVTVETTEAHVKAGAEVSPESLDAARRLLEQAFQLFLIRQQRPDSAPPLPAQEDKPVKR
jgi:hypothetical protein